MVVINEDGVRSLRPFAPAPTQAMHLRVRLFRASRQPALRPQRLFRCASSRGARSPANARPTPTSSCRSPTRATPPRSAIAEESEIPFEMALVRSHYVGRTFIEPRQSIRHFGVKIKFNPVAELLRGQAYRAGRGFAGARNHAAQGDPDAAAGGRARGAYADRRAADDQLVLLRNRHADPRRVARVISTRSRRFAATSRADSLGYLSWDGLYSFIGNGNREGYCDACFTGNYPVEIPARQQPASVASVRRRRPRRNARGSRPQIALPFRPRARARSAI